MSFESGAAGIITAALVAISVVLALLVGDVSRLMEERARLTTAADAAALAAAPLTFSSFGSRGSSHAEAATIAATNGAYLLRCDCEVDRSWSARTVIVTVGVSVDLPLLGHHELTAVAAAEFRPTALASP
jgi:uncharacterized membrane protein